MGGWHAIFAGGGARTIATDHLDYAAGFMLSHVAGATLLVSVFHYRGIAAFSKKHAGLDFSQLQDVVFRRMKNRASVEMPIRASSGAD